MRTEQEWMARAAFLVLGIGVVIGLGQATRLPNGLEVTGTVTADAFVGDGSALTDLNAAQVTSGTIPTNVLPPEALAAAAGDGTNDLIATEADVVTAIAGSNIAPASVTGDGRNLYIPALHDIAVKGAFTSFQTWPSVVERDGELFTAYADPASGEQRVARWGPGGTPQVKTVGPWGDDNHNAPAILWFGDAWHVALSEHGVTDTNYYGRFNSFADIGSITESTNAFDTGGNTTYNQLQDFHGRLYHWFRSNPGYKYRYSDDNGDTWSSVALWAENPQDPAWHFYWKIREGMIREELLAIHSYNSSDATSDYWDMRAGAVRYESGEHRLYYDDTTYETLDASLAGNAMTNWTEVMPSSTTTTYVAWDIRDTDADDGIGVVYVGRTVDYTNSMTYSYAYGDLGGSFAYEDICQADGYIAYEGTRPIVGRAAFDRRDADVIAVWVAQAGSGDDSPRIERYERTAADTWTLTDTIGPMPGYGWPQGPLVPHDSDRWFVVGHRYESYTDYDTFDAGYLWAIGSPKTSVGNSLGRGPLDVDGRLDIPATDYSEPVVRLYHEAYGADSANLGLHQSRIRFTHYNGSGVSLEVATTNVGTWAAGGGDIVFRPGDSYDALRIDRLGEHEIEGNLDVNGNLFSTGYVRGVQARVAGAVFDPGQTNVEGVAVISSAQTPGNGNYGTPIDFTVFGDNATKKAAIVPWQYGADEDQLGLSLWSSVSATKASDIVPAVWIFGPNGRVAGYWIVTGNVTSVSGQFNGSGAGLTGLDGDEVTAGTVADARIAATLTRDTEWDTAAEINAATTDEDFITETDLLDLTVSNLTLTGTFDGLDAMTLSVSNLSAQTVTGPTNYTADADTGMTIAGDLTLSIQGDLITDADIQPDANNTLDIGASATRWRNIYASTGNVTVITAVGITADEFIGGASGMTDVPADEITGTIPASVPHAAHQEILSTSHTLTASECYGGIYYLSGGMTATLPAAADGLRVFFQVEDASACSVDVNAADRTKLDGVDLDDGDKVTSDGTQGAMIGFSYRSADGWAAMSDGLWSDGGP